MSAQSRPASHHAPFNRRDETFYTRLVELSGGDYDARHLWRVLHCWPQMTRLIDLCKREWIVPSTRTEGRLYRVNLNTRECFYKLADGEMIACPDKTFNHRDGCCHYKAALAKEKSMLGNERRGWDDEPAGRSGPAARPNYMPRGQVEL